MVDSRIKGSRNIVNLPKEGGFLWLVERSLRTVPFEI